MLLREVKMYLQIFHLELDEKVLQELEKQKKKAIDYENEPLANELWCLIETYNIQKKYLSMFHALKIGEYKSAWLLLDDIDISMGNLRTNFGDYINQYNLTFINSTIKNYEKMFPDYVYSSRESIIKSEKCSICGKVSSLRFGCEHIPGILYMGELCLRIVTDFELLGIAIVKHPFDKYAIIEIEGKEYNYQILNYLMKKLVTPFRPWYVEQMSRKKTEYAHIGKNDICPCGSEKKYKKCCFNTQKEYGPHYRITLLGGEEMKEEAIDYSGRWIDKLNNS